MAVMRRRSRLLALAICVSLLTLGGAVARADWTTYHADSALSGVDQTSGTPAPFATAWTSPKLDGTIWAEPLVYGGRVFVATENNDIYAFDEATGALVWHVNVGAPVPSSELPCGDISPTVGITSTPVIDPSTGILYAVADLAAGASASHTLVAYNASTGAPVFSRSVEPPSNPLNQLQREGLALDAGRVLIGFGGNDGDCAQYKGFLVSAPTDNNGANDLFTVPTSREGAIWSGGGAPAVDGAGNVYVPTGNAANGPGQSYDHGDTLEKLSSTGTELDYWAPATWAQDSASDADLGSVSPELLPGDLIYQGGKNGKGYLISSTSLGHIGGERYSAPVCNSFGSDAYAAGVLYVTCTSGVRALNIDSTNQRFSPRWTGPSDANGPPILAGGRVWVTSTANSKLYGLDPSTGAVQVTQSTPAMEHFVTPAASDGRLFLATGTTLTAYTIATAVAAPVVTPTPVPPPTTTPPAPVTTTPHPGVNVCRRALSLALRIPPHSRIIRVTLYLGRHRILRAHGRSLRRLRFGHPGSGRFALKVVETPRHGRRMTFTVRFDNCRRVVASHRRG